MKVVLSPEAAERLEAQIAYLRDVGAPAAAERLNARVLSFLPNHFLPNHLARLLRTGRPLRDRDLWEMDSQDTSGALVSD